MPPISPLPFSWRSQSRWGETMAHKPVLILSLRQVDHLIIGRLVLADLPAPICFGPPLVHNNRFTVGHAADMGPRIFIPQQRFTEHPCLSWIQCSSIEKAHWAIDLLRSAIIHSFRADDHTVEEIENLIVVMKVIP